jgi:hypothetical protein
MSGPASIRWERSVAGTFPAQFTSSGARRFDQASKRFKPASVLREMFVQLGLSPG